MIEYYSYKLTEIYCTEPIYFNTKFNVQHSMYIIYTAVLCSSAFNKEL